MKRHQKRRGGQREHTTERLIARKIRQEQQGGFKCTHCKVWVVISQYIGTANRNHCNICLWSKHVDIKKGDRRAKCQAGMEPIGLTFRQEGKARLGEITLIHVCHGCQKISINRIAADDGERRILDAFESSLMLDEVTKRRLHEEGVYLAQTIDRQAILDQLFGYGYAPQ